MAGNGGFGNDPLAPGYYPQLLFAEEIARLETDGCFGFPPFSSSDDSNHSAKMLCFGDYAKQCNMKVVMENETKPGQKSGPACKDSSSLVSSKNDTALPKSSNKKRVGPETQYPDARVGAPTGSQRNGKRSRSDGPTSTGGHARVAKKEKLGERISALQQLVSPFGKSDTASVLHEALGYIRFLQDQVQVLCSPYLQCLPPSSTALTTPDNGEGKREIERRRDDLRSRGLCLVPVELTLHVADSNGADLWSSAAMIDNIPSS